MREYREIPPSPALAMAVECCWISALPDSRTHRVVPDGCADIIFRIQDGRPELIAVGAMSRFSDVGESAAGPTVGIRFRPGMWGRLLGVEADEVTDKTIPLEDLWGARARCLQEQMANSPSPETLAKFLADAVGPLESRTPAQRAIHSMELRRGLVSLDHLSSEAGLSTRQFRRVCLRQAGLSPKLLARILRFRHAQSRAASETGEHALLAAECGFADQAHMIAEFRRFAGRTPGSLSIALPQPIPEHYGT